MRISARKIGSYLDDKIIAYYAGFDEKSLPGKAGKHHAACHAPHQVLYLKALSLVVDQIVIPPTSYLYWLECNPPQEDIFFIANLYMEGILASSIHKGMNSGRDFIAFKSCYGSEEEQKFIQRHGTNLDVIFKPIPVIHRDVGIQSGRFQISVADSILYSNISDRLKDGLLEFLTEDENEFIASSRDGIYEHLRKLRRDMTCSVNEFKQCIHIANRNYYMQGVNTNKCSLVSLTQAHRYSALGKDIFQGIHGVRLAYDPLVILAVLETFGIQRDFVAKLTLDEIQTIRASPTFASFKSKYRQLAEELQRTQLRMASLSKQKIQQAQYMLISMTSRQHICAQDVYHKNRRNWSRVEAVLFALISGALGWTHLGPWGGLVISFVPVTLNEIGCLPSLANLVMQRMQGSNETFYTYIARFKEITEAFTGDEDIRS